MRLGVNIDHVATLRQARLGDKPDPVEAAEAAVRGGADAIVCHLREDRRHIQDRDVVRLLERVRVPLNLEMSAEPEIVEIAMRLRPTQVTFVPERRRELTTEGGLDVRLLGKRLVRLVRGFQGRQVAVSLFVDPNEDQIEAALQTGAKTVELHTGRYADRRTPMDRKKELGALEKAASQARRLGLTVAAGHGLDYENVGPVARLHDVVEVNIGFSIVSRALFVGLEQAVREMRTLLDK